MRIWIFLNLILFSSCKNPIKLELKGPELILFPGPVTYFSNSFGLTIGCSGQIGTTTTWLTSEGHSLQEIPGLREILKNGSLHFASFREEDYQPSVHNTQYRCSVTNPVGTALSPIFNVHAIVDRPFKIFISAADENDIIEENPTLLNCDVSPSSYKDFIKTIHWKSIDQYGHESEIESDGKTYQISSGGSLLILTAKYQQLFICVAQNTLNNKIQSSPPILLKSKAGVGGVGPRSVGKWQRMIFTEIGKNIDLLCLGVGNPSPNFRWEKFYKGKFVPVVSVENRGKIWGPLLSLDEVDSNSSYRCEIFNSVGSLSLDTSLVVWSTPLVELQPKKRTVRAGQNVELECKIPDASANHAEITWFRNGKSLTAGDRLGINALRLSIFNIRYEDQGVYQCFIKIRGYHVGGTSTLVFESSEPELLHTFISQNLQPGSSISLKCSAIGNPIPIITFFVDGKQLPNTNSRPYEHELWRESHHRSAGSHLQLNEIVSHVNISSIRVEDGGVYECIASNLISKVSHSARLNVYGGLFMKEMDQMTHVADKVALIPCLYGGYPVDKILWKQNGSEIDTKTSRSRFRIWPNGTLQIERIKTETDKGLYSCVVSNRKGEIASGTVSVNVLRPPVISSFSFDDNLQENQRTSISCNVMSGDEPIDITWLKDFQPIPHFLNITAMRVKFLSYLIFEELKGVHGGTYSCSASNAASSVTFSAHLLVKVPPKWQHEPSDTRALLKSNLTIPCHATGIPAPTIKWYRESAVMRTAIRSNQQQYQILENGSLRILNISAKDEFNYTCEAVNGVGNGIQKSIRFEVIIPAEVSAPVTTVVVAEGFPALLTCLVLGDRPIQVVWRKNSIVIEHSPRIVLQTAQYANSSVLSAELKIVRSERSDSGVWVCMGSNQYGRDEDAISLHVKARPRPPQDFIVEEIGSRFIRLKWSLNAENSSDPVTHFVLQYKNSSVISWDPQEDFNNISVQAPASQAVLISLTPVTNYEIRILALNEIGRSLPTLPISVATLAEAPSGPPLNVTAIPTSSKTILVTWEQPSPFLQNGAILGYLVMVSHSSISKSNNTLLIDEKWAHQIEIKDLKPNSRYRISTRAYNVAGVGPESPFISVSTPEGAPDSPPLNVLCEALSTKSLQVLWEPPPFQLSNGIIQGYKVIYLPLEAERQGEKPEVKKTINRETTLHGLQSYTNYSVRTLAYTGGGESLTSDPIYCTTEEDVPEEPADIKVLASGPNSVTVSWLPPKLPNGIITKYRVQWKGEDPEGIKEKYYIASMDEDQQIMEVRKLRESKRYSFWVTAATSQGVGKPSQMQTVVVTSKVPARIASFPVKRRPKLELSVVLPCRAVGYPLPEITWLRGSSLPLKSNHIMRNGSLFIPRVKDQEEGVYVCRVENPLGTDEIQHEITISRPPSAVSVVLGYVTSNSIQIHWDPPSKADPPLTGFVIQYRAGNGIEWISKNLGSRLSSYAMENLQCGTNYHVRIAAENGIGNGEFSPILKTKTTGSLPEYPKLTEVLDGNGTMVRIDLNRWPDGGCLIKQFHIEYKSKASNEWKPIQRKGNSTRVFILNTALSFKYDIRISVENEAGTISKTFSVESSPQFFTNYDKLMQNSDDRSFESSVYFFTDPHIIVPVISAFICTTAVIICVLIVVKRKTAPREGWKLGHSSSQQTWLNSDEFRADKSIENSKCEVVPGNSSMSIYATLNSRKPIPMTIRDSTVRFQTFGQVENYEAPSMQTYYNKSRGNSNSSSSHEELVIQEGFAINHPKPREQRELPEHRNRHISTSNDYSIEELCHEYAHPYQVVPMNRGPCRDDETLGRNTMQRKKHTKRIRGFPEHLD